MSVPKEKLLDKADSSIYKLVILAAKRAAEIQAGQPALLKISNSNQPVSIALEEIAAGLVRCKNRKGHHKYQASQKTEEDIPAYNGSLKMDTPFTGSEIVDDDENEEKI